MTNEIFAQSANTFSSVNSDSVCQLNRHRDWLTCHFRVRDASRYFSVPKFQVYRRPGTTRKYIRSHHHLRITDEAAVFIDYIGGATSRLPPNKMRLSVNKQDLEKEENFRHIGIYPTVIRARYNITNEVGKHPNNSQCTPQASV